MKNITGVLAVLIIGTAALAEEATTAPATMPATAPAATAPVVAAAPDEKKHVPTADESKRNALEGLKAVRITYAQSNQPLSPSYKAKLELLLRQSGIRVITTADAEKMEECGEYIPELIITYVVARGTGSKAQIQTVLGVDMSLRLKAVVKTEALGRPVIAIVYEDSWSSLRPEIYAPISPSSPTIESMVVEFANHVMAANGR